MQLKTILNRRYRLKRFVYGKATISDNRLLIEVQPRKNRQPRCGQCRTPGLVDDTRRFREFEFVPILGMAVFFVYAMRRVDCPGCGVKTEHLEWSSGKKRMTMASKWFLSPWARWMSWSGTARVFGTSWNRVYRSVHHGVIWGLVHRERPKFTAIGIDEIALRCGHRYLTLVDQIDQGLRRLLWVGENREEKTLERFFDRFESSVRDHLQFVCSALLKRDCRPCLWCFEPSGSLPRDDDDEQEGRQSESRKNSSAQARRLRTDCQAQSLVPVEATGEPYSETDFQDA